MPVPFLDLKAQYTRIKPDVDTAMQQVVDACAFAGGPFVAKFEEQFAAYCGSKQCIALSTGTAALHLALRGWGIGRGDEVITVANSFFASAEAISLANATPVLVDCNESDALIDVSKLAAAITPKTKAIIPVHLYGQCADMDPILALAKSKGIKVMEDACQAHGATYKGRRAGSMGDAAAFSFYPGKNLGAYGEGGAVTTNDEALAKTIRMLRDHGSAKKYYHTLVGNNDRLDGIQGAVLSVKLPHLDAWNARRRTLAAWYRSKLADEPRVKFFGEYKDRDHVYHLCVVRVPNRDQLQAKMKERGIDTMIHYPVPIHLQEAYKGLWKQGDFPVAEKLALEILSLPMYAELTEQQADEVVKVLKECL